MLYIWLDWRFGWLGKEIHCSWIVGWAGDLVGLEDFVGFRYLVGLDYRFRCFEYLAGPAD